MLVELKQKDLNDLFCLWFQEIDCKPSIPNSHSSIGQSVGLETRSRCFNSQPPEALQLYFSQLNLYKYIFLIFEFTIPYLNIHCTRTCTHTHTYIGILKLLYIKYRLNTEDGGGPKAPKGFIWRKAYAKRTKKTPEKNKENLLDRVLNITSFKT